MTKFTNPAPTFTLGEQLVISIARRQAYELPEAEQRANFADMGLNYDYYDHFPLIREDFPR